MRGSNTGYKNFQGGVPGEIEMAALEDLGPRARYVLSNAPLLILAAPIVQQIVEANDKIEIENERRIDGGFLLPQIDYLDPKRPDLDQRIAQSIVDFACTALRLDNVAEVDIVNSLRPLVGRPSPKSLREQRRAMRNVRWSTSARSQTR